MNAPCFLPAHWLSTDDIEGGAESAARPTSPRPEDLAFLQYTSGSTGERKGVMVTHASIAHNLEVIRNKFEESESTVGVGWLPLFHDMGLVGNVMEPVHLGIPCILMPPMAFLQRPSRWLHAITRYRGTTCGGPNFAYDMCVDRIPRDEREGLDLSTWKVAFNGSEPIRAETLERFSDAFAPFGFRREAFYPCYGMAEVTLLVAGGARDEPPRLVPVDAEALEAALDLPSGAGMVRRRPFFHDWGLIDCVLFPTYAGLRCVVLDPLTFLYRPLLWLQSIDRYRAAITGAPNFAYELCLTAITDAERQPLDLSTWQVAMVGAEPVRSHTLRGAARRDEGDLRRPPPG